MGYYSNTARLPHGVNCVFIKANKWGTCQKDKRKCKRLTKGDKRCPQKRLRYKTASCLRIGDKRHEYAVLNDMFSAVSSALHNVFRLEERKFRDKTGETTLHGEERKKLGHYHFIPRPTGDVVKMLKGAYDYIYFLRRERKNNNWERPLLVDCGCGVGNVIILAESLGFDAWGIEYDEKTVERGKRLLTQFGIKPEKIVQGDVTKYLGYNKFDVVYGYCPMCNSTKEQEFERTVRGQMKVGAILSGLTCDVGPNKTPDPKEFAYFQKVSDGSNSYSYGRTVYLKVG